MAGRIDKTRWQYNEATGNWSRAVAVAPDEAPAAEPDSDEVAATAAAVTAAEELGVDITQVEGSGLKGKVTKADVENAAE